MSYHLPESRSDAQNLDRHDILAHARQAFDLEGGVTYLVGHSLGPASHTSLDALEQAARYDWRRGLVRSWNEAGWFDLAQTTGRQLARLIGAGEGEVLVADSVSANLFKLAAGARTLARSPALIVEADEFPTDQYVIESLAGLSGRDFVRAEPGTGLDRLGETGGTLVRSLVNYRTSEVRDMAAEERAASAAGGVIIWDLSHATGVIEVHCGRDGARLAAGCTYKYLNGGPGAPGFAYVREDLQAGMDNPLAGWMGHARPFAFEPSYEATPGIRRLANGTPPILSLAALSGALEAFESLDVSLVAEKARVLGDFVTRRALELGLDVASPIDGGRRGGHVSLRHPNAHEIVQALAARKILTDFRTPDTLRLGLSPLFLRFTDVWDAMAALEDILRTKAWDKPEFRKRQTVT